MTSKRLFEEQIDDYLCAHIFSVTTHRYPIQFFIVNFSRYHRFTYINCFSLFLCLFFLNMKRSFGNIRIAQRSRNRTHFVEYLVGIVAKANIDSLPILDLTDCVQELRRRGIPLPERGPW